MPEDVDARHKAGHDGLLMITFNTILRAEGIDPTTVRLLRHQDTRRGAPTPYRLWRADDGRFETYQSIQRRNLFPVGSFLASFVATPANETLFVGLYVVENVGPIPPNTVDPVDTAHDLSGFYWLATKSDARLDDYTARLVIDWGSGFRTWAQLAGRQEKPVVEIRSKFEEPAFPGFMPFVTRLSEIEALPKGWADALQASRGVYLLTCPMTKEQYVGSASGSEGFLGRWRDYVQTGHGGNVGLKSRDPSDYQVAILEVAGSAVTTDDVLRMEHRWKAKLQSVEMGLNRN